MLWRFKPFSSYFSSYSLFLQLFDIALYAIAHSMSLFPTFTSFIFYKSFSNWIPMTPRLFMLKSPLLSVNHKYTDKKRKSSFPHISWNSKWGSCKVIYDKRPPRIWGNICAFPHILGSPSSNITLQLRHSEFPYIWGKFDFLFFINVFFPFHIPLPSPQSRSITVM